MARKPVEERKPYLAEAEPVRLMAAGGGLLAATGLLSIVFIIDLGSGHGQLIRKSNEGATKGNLGSIRSALSVHYGDMGGVYPASLDALTTGGKYLPSIPWAKAPNYHQRSNAVLLGKVPDDTGGWLYNNDAKDKDFGKLMVNCTHTDSKGSFWTAY